MQTKKIAFMSVIHENGGADLTKVEPATYKSTLTSSVWCEAIKEELSALHNQGRYKARLVAKGFNQEEGIDYGETFSPVVKPTTVRLVIALAAHYGWCLRQLDVKNAFLHGILQEETLRAWNDKFTKFLPSLGFQSTYSDSSLFVKHADKYVTDLLTKSEMLSSKPYATPCLPYNGLLKDDGKPYNNPALYGSLVGALQYLTFTRPDIAFAVHQVSQFMQAPMESHFLAVKRVLRYLQATQGCGIRYVKGGLDLKAFSDADWAGDPNDRQSTIGLVSVSNTPTLYCDNLSAIALTLNLVQHQRTKHIEVDIHFVRERVDKQLLQVHFVSSGEQFADIFIKGLSAPLFQRHCNNLRLSFFALELEGGYWFTIRWFGLVLQRGITTFEIEMVAVFVIGSQGIHGNSDRLSQM
ncbi:unnamed protein product [Malus baccata var. baccata]